MKEYFLSLPKLRTVQDELKDIPEIGYMNDDGYTVLPSEHGRD